MALFDAAALAKLAAYEELDVAISVVDVDDGVIVYANASGLALLGCGPVPNPELGAIWERASKDGPFRTTDLLEPSGRASTRVTAWTLTDDRRALLVEGRPLEELERQHAFIDSLLEHLPNMVFVKEARELRFVRLNRAGEQLLGYSRDDLLGKNDYDFFPADQADFFTAMDREVLERGDVTDIPEEPIQTREHGRRWLHTKKIPIRDANGEPTYLLGVSEDITGRRRQGKALAAAENRFRTICEHAPVMIASFNEKGACTLWNRECEAQLGWTKEDLGQPEQNLPFAVPDAVADGEFREFKVPDKAGRVRDQLWADFALPSGEAISVGLDITERKGAERQLEAQAAALARSNSALEAFAYVASHDLQEPLRMVASYVGLLKKRYQGALDERADRYIGYAIDGAIRMQRMLEDILELSRVGRAGRDFQSVDLREVVDAALRVLPAMAVTVGPLPTVRGDKDQLARLFQNVIGNALKFRGEEEPRIEVDAAPVGDVWEVRVRDNGIGFEPRHAERIFEMFHRLGERGKYEGSGIGLAIVAKIVELHGGRVWAEGRPGEGATLTFTLPRSEPRS